MYLIAKKLATQNYICMLFLIKRFRMGFLQVLQFPPTV
uniref:Uncharacterized protein n=1 Tax=Anguilla anguilla TaxID=7936 RepID=A0A0E9QZL2_ANGAN